MATARIAISMDSDLLARVDALVRSEGFASRSAAIRAALRERVRRLDDGLLARESAKLDPAEEQAMADEGLAEDVAAWPDY